MRLRITPALFAIIVLVLGAMWSLCLGGEDTPNPPAVAQTAPAAPQPDAPAAPAPDVAPAKKEEEPAGAIGGGDALVPKSFGQMAYEAYAASTGWKSAVSGAPLPTWAAQAEVIKAAWEAAAKPLVDRLISARQTTDEAIAYAQSKAAELALESDKGAVHVTELLDEIRRLKGLMTGAGLPHYSKI